MGICHHKATDDVSSHVLANFPQGKVWEILAWTMAHTAAPSSEDESDAYSSHGFGRVANSNHERVKIIGEDWRKDNVGEGILTHLAYAERDMSFNEFPISLFARLKIGINMKTPHACNDCLISSTDLSSQQLIQVQRSVACFDV